MIRAAGPTDIPRLIQMGARFLRETPYRGKVAVVEDQMERVVRHLLEQPNGMIFVLERAEEVVGMIGFMVFDHPISGDSMASELFWWVDPEHRNGLGGVQLLRRAEQWARRAGATRMQMIAPDEHVGSFYQRLGYEPLETTFQRTL